MEQWSADAPWVLLRCACSLAGTTGAVPPIYPETGQDYSHGLYGGGYVLMALP